MELPELTPGFVAFLAIEATLYLGGLAAFFLWQFGRGAERRREVRLVPWEVKLTDFLLALLLILIAGLALQLAAVSLQRILPQRLDPDAWLIVQGAAFQFGLLLGAGLSRHLLRPRSTLPGGDPVPPAPLPVSPCPV
ncbi:MAG: hypothetical protein JNN01_08485, partial [Opitutaceae bacterium]|nr:hypothetical protein [Opitutaceae bacterium]